MSRRGRSRRTIYDPLEPTMGSAWYVVRDVLRADRDPLEIRRLEPGADLRPILVSERKDRIADGWSATEIGASTGFFFCTKGGTKLLVTIVKVEPGTSTVGHSSSAYVRD